MATSAPKAANKAGAKPDSEQPAAPKKKLIIIAAAAVLLLAGAGGGAWFFLGSKAQHADKPAKEQHKPAAAPVFMALETFTVNLQGEDMQQFLQVNMTLQVADEATVEHLKTNMPQVRNRLLLLLSSKKATEILTVEGKKKLSTEIVEQIQQPFTPNGPKPEVSDVFFTSFVVQ
ncbi:flagellar basal body-associated protein FliL [Noviherbaspirillum sp. UKPF54]|uniref:flagellar basal body-associated protein FliL n=1 Tax=Noviherbaspirillum sp. UKPF54 TaxID=2601898 RepID=UPI0011B14D76|nr:flagellar basal body-associated protein FliL [Noviherbaspirillum sp. UKPF54]QDZ28113.1 flagellar basal body-associated protein FliL [Noviherbaspirillum sp. UKPF54]